VSQICCPHLPARSGYLPRHAAPLRALEGAIPTFSAYSRRGQTSAACAGTAGSTHGLNQLSGRFGGPHPRSIASRRYVYFVHSFAVPVTDLTGCQCRLRDALAAIVPAPATLGHTVSSRALRRPAPGCRQLPEAELSAAHSANRSAQGPRKVVPGDFGAEPAMSTSRTSCCCR